MTIGEKGVIITDVSRGFAEGSTLHFVRSGYSAPMLDTGATDGRESGDELKAGSSTLCAETGSAAGELVIEHVATELAPRLIATREPLSKSASCRVETVEDVAGSATGLVADLGFLPGQATKHVTGLRV